MELSYEKASDTIERHVVLTPDGDLAYTLRSTSAPSITYQGTISPKRAGRIFSRLERGPSQNPSGKTTQLTLGGQTHTVGLQDPWLHDLHKLIDDLDERLDVEERNEPEHHTLWFQALAVIVLQNIVAVLVCLFLGSLARANEYDALYLSEGNVIRLFAARFLTLLAFEMFRKHYLRDSRPLWLPYFVLSPAIAIFLCLPYVFIFADHPGPEFLNILTLQQAWLGLGPLVVPPAPLPELALLWFLHRQSRQEKEITLHRV